MIKRTLGFLSLCLLIAAGFYLSFSRGDLQSPAEKVFEPQVLALPGLPSLEDEKSPLFSRQTRTLEGGAREEIYCFRRDKSVAHLYFGKNNLLRRVEAYRNDAKQQQLAYEADYDAGGRRITRARYYGENGRLDTLVERSADGTQTHSFYRAEVMIRQTRLAADGTLSTVNFENGKPGESVTSQAPSQTQVLVWWDAAKTKPRLRVKTLGARLAGWEYFKEDGGLDHTGKVLADESLEFSYVEKDKLKRRQVWRLVGEDWERSYYGLSYSEAFADDGKTVEHKVWVRSNGSLKRHERYNGKTGELEMDRDFDEEGRVARIEEHGVKKPEEQKIWFFPRGGNRSRGFVPSGMRDYPGGDDKIGYVYNLDGKPFTHSVLDPHPWASSDPARTKGACRGSRS